MSARYILAVDQGTSGTKAIVFDNDGKLFCKATEPLKTYYFDNGFVEQEPEDIYQNVLCAVKKCIAAFIANGGNIAEIEACGISNQRETFVVWDESGQPLHNAVVWQCKRSVDICTRLKNEGVEPALQERTGLIIDPYFSGTKLVWLYENIDKIRVAVDKGNAYFGTVDTWLLYKLTKGESYFTDYTNASRTLLFNIRELTWDEEMLRLFHLSNIQLPAPKPSSYLFGCSVFEGVFDKPLAITAMAGDSHAAAFGEGCFTAGMAKATLGTGCSVLMNIGGIATPPAKGMVTTICWSTEDRVDYALEGVIVSCGSTIEWLKNELGLFTDSKETEAMANAVADNNGVYLVPAFSGLGAPYWDMKRKASITGLTFSANKNHIVRAALESIAYQIKDVIDAMSDGCGINVKELMVNGGITSNQFVLKFLAGVSGLPVTCGYMHDISALGAAYLAGLKADIYANLKQLVSLGDNRKQVTHNANKEQFNRYHAEWKTIINTKS